MAAPYFVYRRPERPLNAALRGWPERPTWLVNAAVGGIDFNIAGFPSWQEAFEYAFTEATRELSDR